MTAFGQVRLIGGPKDGQTVAMHGTPKRPLTFWSYRIPRAIWGDSTEPAETEYPEEPKKLEYAYLAKTKSGLYLYEYVPPTEEAELAVKVTVPASMTTKERGEIAGAFTAFVNRNNGCHAELHYTGPVR